MYLSDKPIKEKKYDILNYSLFASQLANTIKNINEDFVVSLQGPWGCGKTSIINLFKKEINSLNKKNRDIKIIEFNPWNCITINQLIQQFFLLLQEEIGSPLGSAGNNIKEAISSYAASLESSLDPRISIPARIVGGFNKKTKDESLNSQRKTIEKELENIKYKILIIIDDIDRLPDEQICLMFQLVKSIANFPNISYLLSYDLDIVTAALSNIHAGETENYLNKIVQLPFNIPKIDERSIQKSLKKRLEKIRDKFSQEEKGYLDNDILNECIYPFITSLRDANRLCNSLIFIYPPIVGMVNFEDLVAIETLKLFATPIYDYVFRNKKELTHQCDKKSNFFKSEEDAKKCSAIKEECKKLYPKNPKAAEDAINFLFWQNKDVYVDALMRDRKISSRKFLDAYFSLNLNATKALDWDIKQALKTKNDLELHSLVEECCENGAIDNFFDILLYCFSDKDIEQEYINKTFINATQQSKYLRTDYLSRTLNTSPDATVAIFEQLILSAEDSFVPKIVSTASILFNNSVAVLEIKEKVFPLIKEKLCDCLKNENFLSFEYADMAMSFLYKNYNPYFLSWINETVLDDEKAIKLLLLGQQQSFLKESTKVSFNCSFLASIDDELLADIICRYRKTSKFWEMEEWKCQLIAKYALYYETPDLPTCSLNKICNKLKEWRVDSN